MLPPTLKVNTYILKPYDADDEDRFVEMALDQEVIWYMDGANGQEEEERKLFKKIQEIYGKREEKWFWIWGIYQEDRLCGHVELKETSHTAENELEIVYMMHPAERRKGIMTAILFFIKNQQNHWGKRIIATVQPANRQSISLLKKWGIEETERIIDHDTREEYLKLTLRR